jgi:hypothetical protein
VKTCIYEWKIDFYSCDLLPWPRGFLGLANANYSTKTKTIPSGFQGTDQLAADRKMCSVLNITLLVHVGGNAESFICRRAPHFSTVSGYTMMIALNFFESCYRCSNDCFNNIRFKIKVQEKLSKISTG